jgi:hypothetical protein
MSSRYFVEDSSGRSVNPQKNPSSITALSDFKIQPSFVHKDDMDIIFIVPKKKDMDNIYASPITHNKDYTEQYNTIEGVYTPANAYIQPSVSGNYILPHGSAYFDERLTIDYIDRAVRTAEDNAYSAQSSSQIANIASHSAYHDAERAGQNVDYHYNNNGRR